MIPQLTAESRVALSKIVEAHADDYDGVDYPFCEEERIESERIRQALKTLGFDVTLAGAAAIWEFYSRVAYQAQWMEGPRSAEAAQTSLIYFAQEVVDGEVKV